MNPEQKPISNLGGDKLVTTDTMLSGDYNSELEGDVVSVGPSAYVPPTKLETLVNVVRSQLKLVTTFALGFLLIGSIVGFALVKASRSDQINKTVNSVTTPSLPSQSKQTSASDLLTINSRLRVVGQTSLGDLQVRKSATIAGDLFVSGDATFAAQVKSDSVVTNSLIVAGKAVFSGSLRVSSISGNGSGLTAINADSLAGNSLAYFQDAGHLESGTLDDARLSSNIARLSADNVFRGSNNFVTVTAGSFSGNGSNITSLNADNLSSGIVSSGVGGTGIDGSTAANGKLLIGNGNGFTLANLIQGNGISVTNSSGAITIGVDNSVCTTAGNCAGSGGGVTTAGGTSGAIALFTGSQSIGSSILNQIGGTITVDGDLSVSQSLQSDSLEIANSIVFSAFGAGILQTSANGGVSGGALDRNSGLLSGQTSIANGGTGAINAADARNNLSAAASGSNSDITALNNVSNLKNTVGPLTVGDTSQALTLQGNATTVLNVSDGGFTTSVGFTAPTSNVNYRFATAPSGNYDICTSTGNCAGAGGGVTTLGGNSGIIALFTGTSTIANSLLSQTGSTVSVSGTLSATALQGSGASITNLNGTNISSGTVGVSFGGTGGNSFTQNGIIFGNGIGPLHVTAAGTSGQCLFAITNMAPIWTDCAVAAEGAVPGGPAGRDLGGNYPDPIVVGLYNTPLNISNLSGGNLLLYDGVNWVNAVVGGDISVNASGVATIADGAVSNNKLANSSIVINSGAGLTGGGVVALGAATTFNVNFGSVAGSVVEGSITIGCTAGSGNLTGGGNSITLGTGGTCGSLDVITNPSFNSLSLTSALTVANGGTGAINALGARNNLGAAASGANSDITSLSSVTSISGSNALAIGAIGQALTLQGNASTTFTATSSGKTTTLNFQTPTANVTYRLPTAAAGTYDLCSTTGNCAGAGNSVTTSGGTVNTIALFTGSQAIGNSILSQSGATVSVDGNLAINGGSITSTSSTVNVFNVKPDTINFGGHATTLSIGSNAGTTTINNALKVTATATIGNSFSVTNTSGTQLFKVNNSGVTVIGSSGNYGQLSFARQSDGAGNATIGYTGATNEYQLKEGSSNGFFTFVTGSATPTEQLRVANNGYVGIGTGASISARLQVNTSATTNVGQIIKGYSAQSADLLQLQNNSGNVLSGFNAAGQLYYQSGSYTNTIAQGSLTQNQTITIPASNSANDTICLLNLQNCVGTGSSITGTGTPNYVAKFNGGQNVSNSLLYDDGSFVGVGTTASNGFLSIQGSSASQSTLFVQGTASATADTVVLKAATGQTGNILSTQDASGAPLLQIGVVNGAITTSGTITTTASGYFGGTGSPGNPTLTVFTQAKNKVGLYLKGSNQQTADLIDIVTVGGGGVVSGFNANGQLFNQSNGFSGVFSQNALSANRVYALPDESGSICVIGGASCSAAYIQNTTLQQAGANFNVGGNGIIGGTLGVAGDTALAGNLAVNGGNLTSNSATANLFNTTPTTINFGGNATALNIGSSSGLTTIKNALSVAGTTTINNTLSVTGLTTASSGLQLGLANTTNGILTLLNAGNSNAVTLQSAAQANNLALTIPVDANSSDTICLQLLANCGGGGTGFSGSGTANYVARFTAASALGNGLLYDTGVYGGYNITSQLNNSNFGIQAANGSIGLTVKGSSSVTGGADVANFLNSSGVGFSVLANGNVRGNGAQFSANIGVTGLDASIGITNTNTSATAATTSALQISLTGTANSNGGNVLNGINLPTVTVASGNTFNGINLGANYTNGIYASGVGTGSLLNVGGTNIIGGTGLVQNAAFDSTLNYSNLQKVTSLTASGNLAVTGTGSFTAALTATAGVLTNLLDATASGNSIAIGTTNATAGIALNQSTTLAAGKNLIYSSGAGTFDQSASTGTFKTSSGAVSLNGSTTIASGKNLTLTSGDLTVSNGAVNQTLTKSVNLSGSTSYYANSQNLTVTATGTASTGVIYGTSSVVSLGGSTLAGTQFTAGDYEAFNNGTGTIGQVVGLSAYAGNNTTGTITSARGGYFSLFKGTGTITDGYDLYLADATGQATNAYALYSAGGANLLNTGSAATIGLTIKGAASQTADLQRFLSSTGAVLAGRNATGQLYYQSGSFTGTLTQGSLTANRTYSLPDESGTVCIVGSASCNAGYIQNTTTAQSGGNFNITGNGVIGGSLTVTTAATFNGVLTAKSATFNGILTVSGHIISGNTSGTTTIAAGVAANCASAASAVTLSGNDTAGVISFTTGSASCSAGTLATVTFSSAYGAAPTVVLTPGNAVSAAAQYYQSSATGNFTLATGTAPVSGTQYTYSYHIIQ